MNLLQNSSMKAVILAAGFGTRLERDLKADASGKYRHLIGVPKPLLPIGDESLVTHWMEILGQTPQVDQVYVLTNGNNHAAFEEWARNHVNVQLICDGSCSNEERTGAVGCMNLAVQQFGMMEDVLIIAGDTLFYEDFDLGEKFDKFAHFKSMDPEANMLLFVTCTDSEVHKYGILETDSEFKVTGFIEKPQPHETLSRKECPCFYFLNKYSLPLLQQFLQDKKDEPLKTRDATGNFISYLYTRKPVYATDISGRFDVGGLGSYITCHKYFLKKKDQKAADH